MPLNLREDNGPEDLDPEQVDANWKSLYDVPAALTIVGGVLDVTAVGQGTYTVETEGGAAADDLTQINGLPAGQIVILSAVNATHAVTLIHGANLRLQGGESMTLDSLYSTIILKSHNGTVVKELHRCNVP